MGEIEIEKSQLARFGDIFNDFGALIIFEVSQGVGHGVSQEDGHGVSLWVSYGVGHEVRHWVGNEVGYIGLV